MINLTKKARKLAKVLINREYRQALFRAGVAASIEHERTLKLLNCCTVVDIGANRGQFALAARRCFPNASIFSFEPLPGPATKFRSVFGDDAQVRLHEVAIGDESGTAIIHVSAADDSSSLLPISALQNELFSGTHEVGTQTIRIEPLGLILTAADIEPPALLKLDVQGYELVTLKGCRSMLDRFQYAYVECSFLELYEGQALADDVCAFMRDCGWSLGGAYNLQYDLQGRAIQADLLFVSKQSTSAKSDRNVDSRAEIAVKSV